MDNVITRSPWTTTAPTMRLPVENEYPDNMARFIAPIDRRELFDDQGNKASHVGLFDAAQCVGTVSPSYKVIQNRVAHDMMEGSIREGGYHGELEIIPTQGGRSGGRWSVRYVLKDLCFSIRQLGKHHETKVSLEIILRNSYDNTTGTSVAVSMFDHFCDNGMIFNSLAEVFKAKHTRHAEDTMFRVSPDQIATVTAWSTPRNTAEAMPSVRRRQNTDPLALGEGRQDRAVVWIANLQNMARAA